MRTADGIVLFSSPLVRIARGLDENSCAWSPSLALGFPRRDCVVRAAMREVRLDTDLVIAIADDGRSRGELMLEGLPCDWFLLRSVAFAQPKRRDSRRGAVRAIQDLTEGLTCGRTRPRTYLRQRLLTELLRRRPHIDALAVEEATLLLVHDVVEELRAPDGAGSTPVTYRHQLRLRRSLELLAGRDGDIGGVARQLGFASCCHFTTAFHVSFGITPSTFQEVIREIEPFG